MQTYGVDLHAEAGDSFYCKKAADSVDLDIKKKLKHSLNVTADIDTEYNIGLIIGASGSGKTTLAKTMFNEFECLSVDESKCVIDLFPDYMGYEDRAEMLTGIGLSAVPCWIKPINTLSNGQKERAKAALTIAKNKKNGICVIDEWTSVVDRTTAKIMSSCVAKVARRNNIRVVLLSCHYDIVSWINPCWVIDCNEQSYTDRRLLCRDYKRKDTLEFEIRRASRESWRMFSKYHYLSENLPGGRLFIFGLFHNGKQIGFQCFANYVPNNKMILHFNRTVIHPDFQGYGLGIHLINETCDIIKKMGYRVMGRFASIPVAKALSRHDKWKLLAIKRKSAKHGNGITRKTAFRDEIKTYSFEYIG